MEDIFMGIWKMGLDKGRERFTTLMGNNILDSLKLTLRTDKANINIKTELYITETEPKEL